jgi:hypothetical protein
MKHIDKKKAWAAAAASAFTITQLIPTGGVATRYAVRDETARVWFREKIIGGNNPDGDEWRTTMLLLLKAERRPKSHFSKERISESMRAPVSVGEAAEETGMAEKTVRLKMSAGDFGFSFKIGRLRYVDRRDFEDYCAMRAGQAIEWH